MPSQAITKSVKLAGQKGYDYNPFVQPFLKWAGGKRQLISEIQKYIPQKYTQYYEPFVGAGAVLFALQPTKAMINDTNPELINCYEVIRDHPDELLTLCQVHKYHNSKEYYYKLRKQDREPGFKTLSTVARAARILYLNKTCFNGLFRVNSRGQFNVPYGNYVNPVIADPDVIQSVSLFLKQRSIKICNGDFESVASTARKGAFLYFDPPYHPISDTSSFTGYSIHGFGEREQQRLKVLCDKLTDRGCHVLISNSNAPLIYDLYNDDRYEIIDVNASRAINSVGSKRGKVGELLIHNKYGCQSV